MRKYPTSVQDFRKLIRDGFVYVDKTQHIHDLVTYGGYYFLSRPRRFGKSLLVSTMDYLFQGEQELFQGTHIHSKWDWDTTFPVIRLSFAKIDHKNLQLTQALELALQHIAENHGLQLTQPTVALKFQELIHQLYAQQGPVVVLIDEYDKPIIDWLGKDTKKAIENRETMKGFYSILKDADPYLRFVFLTGVSRFSKVSVFSDLNNLEDLTFDSQFAAICGISQEELEQGFPTELQQHDRAKIKQWYNGYTWDLKTYVYNPYSLLNFLKKGQYQNFWFETGTPTFLAELAKRQKIIGETPQRATPAQLNSFDLERLNSIAVMFQTGYLTLDGFDAASQIYTLTYPNAEVRQSFLEALADAYIGHSANSPNILAARLKEALENLDLDSLKNHINALFASIPYDLWQRENEHFYHAILHLTFNLLGLYTTSEVHSRHGRMDALLQLKNGIFAFEFKLDRSAGEALQQIKDKGYLEPFVQLGQPCYAIGVNFSKKDKAVEGMEWEKLVS